MKYLQSVFVNYAAIFLLLPFSVAVGLYAIHESDFLLTTEYFYLFLFYVFFAVMPFYFLFFRPRKDFGQEIFSILNNFFDRFRVHKNIYLAFIVLFSFFYFILASIRISTYYERDRWILNDNLPIFPIDVVIPQRLALVADWFAPIDIAVAIPNFIFVLGWLAFLIYVSKDYRQQWYVAIFAFISTFSSVLLFQTMYASFEFPSAMLGFIGLYGIWRRKFNVGFFFLVLSASFKNTGAFQIVSGVALFLFICWQDKDIRKSLTSLDAAFISFLALYLVANYWGHLYYNLVLIDPSVLVDPVSDQVFWFSPFRTFVLSLLGNHALILILGAIGLFADGRNKLFSVFSLGLLLFTRSLSVRADSGYATIFVPAISFLSLFGIAYLYNRFDKGWKKNLLFFLIVGINGYYLFGVLSHFPGGMNHVNSNFDEFVDSLAAHFPYNGIIYGRDISIRPYLYEARGEDLDSMRFPIYPDNKDDFISVLSESGCRMIVAEQKHLSAMDIDADEMRSMGYSEKPFQLRDDSEQWVAYSKECD